MTLTDEVRAALSMVRDPELDESITELSFVQDIRVSGSDIEVDLRLPTYFCAPNFAYLMVADAHDAVRSVAGSGHVVVRLLDHFASDEINAGVAAEGGFTDAFPGLATDELHELRLVFQRKAHQAAQQPVAAAMLRSGWTLHGLVEATLDAAEQCDAVQPEDLQRLLRRRAELQLSTDVGAPLMLDLEGIPMTADLLPVTLRLAKTTRVSIEANGEFCRGLLSVRYPGQPGAAAGLV